MRFTCGISAAVLLAVTAAPADGQSLNRATLTPRGGMISFDKASGIEPGVFVGVDLNYNVFNNLALGLAVEVARPTTRGEDFIAQIKYGDTTFLFEVTQPITVLTGGLNARAEFAVGTRLTPFLMGGVGMYKVYLDPQAASGHETFNGLLLNIGGGVNVSIREGIGLQLDVRDHIYTGYERDDLSPIAPQFRATRFVDDVPAPPEAKETVHNIVLSLGFSFRPSRTAGGNAGGN